MADNPFANLKTFEDYNKADQDFQARKALAAQQLQTGGIDAASKANIYKTQVLSGAVAGGQPAFDTARAQLQQMGIDTSDIAPDVQTASQQLNASRLAQSPLGPLINAGLKDQANQIAAASAMGNANQTEFPSLLGGVVPGLVKTGSPQPAPIAPKAAPRGTMTAPQQAANMADLYSADNAPVQTNVMPNAVTSGAPAPANITAPGDTQVTQVATPTIKPFSFRAQQPGETLGAYKDAQQQAFEQYKAVPDYLKAKAKSEALGKDQADAEKNAIGAAANYDQVVQTINGIKSLIDAPGGLPQDRYGVPAGAKAWFSQNFGDQLQANNANAFTKLNEAQTIGAIKELASTGQIRMTRTLENILNRGYLIESGASDVSKKQQADTILAELQNSKVAAQNVDTGLNGGAQGAYTPMPTAAASNNSGIKFLGFK